MEDQLEFIIDTGLDEGASYVEARYQHDYYESNILKNGNPEVSSFETKRGIGIRVLVNGGLGFAATNQLSRDDLRELVDNVVSSARESARIRSTPIEFSEEEMCQASFEVSPKVAFDSISLEERMALLKEVDESAVSTANKSDVKLPGRYFSLDTWTTEKMLMNSDGAKIYSQLPRAAIDVMLTAHDPQKGPAQRMFSKGKVSGWEAMKEWELTDKVSQEVETLGKVLKEAESFDSEVCDVVLGPEVVGIVSHESSGHPGEADRILGREAAQAGETYLGQDSVSKEVGSDVVNVVEDPTIPHSFGYYLYDDEGVEAKKRYLIKDGRINDLLHNRETAKEFGGRSNASARAVAYNREPIVRMANTFVEPGDHSKEELIEGVDSGLYIKNFMEWNIDDRRFNQRYVGLVAYRIEGGEVRHMVRNPVLEITTTGLWSSVDAVGKNLEFSSGYCGKGDPMQGLPVWMGGPHMRLSEVRMEGST